METARIGLNAAGAALTPVEYILQRMAEPAVEQANWRDLWGAARNAFTPAPPEDEDLDRARELFEPLREVTSGITDLMNSDEHIATAQRFARDTRALLADGRAQEAEARIIRMQLALDAMRRLV
jgi:hypothetical protein